MSKNMAPEADGLNVAETEVGAGHARHLIGGGAPKFKRKRSWWRAYRRGDYVTICSPKTFADLAQRMLHNPNINSWAPDGQLFIVRTDDK